MGLIDGLLNMVFGGGRNAIRETVGIFRENAEAGAARAQVVQGQAMVQHGKEFEGHTRRGFDGFMDGVNRIPRPALALGTLGLFVAAMVDPIWFAERMQGIALVPEPLWWLLGVIVSFYFGARHQQKTQDFQRTIATTMSQVPQVVENIRTLRALRADSPGAADAGTDTGLATAAVQPETNPALDAWRKARAA
ncbi:holin family protein [Sulfitobacter sp. D35]|uniref:holin family protein n=1 Tax=Sulfitobacter sp. D35 TaxID=3083252 RepID=UPI00296FD4D8|nr:holin family protein [Sulfitobacter sp. D35]MDW4497528.1 holin family protein [Sulfitobacter sp. D35]